MNLPSWLDVTLRSAIVYLALLAGLRLAGKRHSGNLSPHDLVLMLLVSNAVQNAMVGQNSSLVGGIVSWPATATSVAPSPVAVADIPADYLALYQQAAARFGIDWAVLAAIGKIECDHGSSQAAGCNPPGSVNDRAGALCGAAS